MREYPTIEELRKRITELEHQNDMLKSEALKYRSLNDSLPCGTPVPDGRTPIDISERSEMGKALKNSEHRYRSLFENMLHEVHIWELVRDEAGVIKTWKLVDANPTALNSWDKTLSEIVGKTADDIFPKSHATELFMPVVKKIFEEGVPHIWESYFADTRQLLQMVSIPCGEYFISTGLDITERKKSEEAIKESEALLNYSQQLSAIGSFVWNLKTDDLHWSKNMYRIHGIDENAFQGNLADVSLKLIHPDDQESVRTQINKMIEAGRVWNMEFRIIRSDGVERIMRSSGEFTLDENGKPVKCIGVHQDITDQKQAENTLRQRESQYNAIVENTSDYIMRYNRKHQHFYANRGTFEATGLLPEQFLGKTHREMGFPEHLCELWEKNIDDVFATGEVRRVEFDVELKDGVVSLDLQLNPEFDSKGRVQSVIGISRDITDLITAQREDRLHKARLEFINEMSNTPDLTEKNICDLVLEKMVHLTESRFGFLGFIAEHEQEMEIYAWSSSAMAECTTHDDKTVKFPIKKAGLWAEPVRNRKAVIINDYAADHPAKKGCPEGHIPIVRFMSIPVFEKGRIVLVAAVANKSNPYTDFDIRHFDLLMNNAWERIQLRRIRNDREILMKRLHQAQKMESIGNLAGGIAHDFNNLLASIIGFTELAMGEVQKGSSLESSLQEVYRAGERARDLVKQILAFARQSDEKKSPIQPGIVAKEVQKFLRSTIPSTIDIRHHIESDAWIMGSATQIHQVLMNLCTNAAHAMEDTGGVLEIRVKDVKIGKERLPKGMRPGAYIEIRVSDTGTGISPEIIGSIFEPYFTTKGPGEGTGLGLAVAQGVVESHGGKIFVASQMGKGTTFTLYLPITKKQSENDAYVLEPLPTGTERILFVDDEAAIAEIGKRMLEQLGYSVETRTRSIDALALFRARPKEFDLVVTDMTMPDLTGDRFAVEVMKIRPDIPVILCTGYSKKISEETAYEIGIKALAYKPIVKADLAGTVRKVLDESKGKI